MTLKEFEERLKALGIPEGEWKNLGGKKVNLPLVSPMKPLLLQIRKIAQAELESKIKEREKLHEMLGRLRHGGAM